MEKKYVLTLAQLREYTSSIFKDVNDRISIFNDAYMENKLNSIEGIDLVIDKDDDDSYNPTTIVIQGREYLKSNLIRAFDFLYPDELDNDYADDSYKIRSLINLIESESLKVFTFETILNVFKILNGLK